MHAPTPYWISEVDSKPDRCADDLMLILFCRFSHSCQCRRSVCCAGPVFCASDAVLVRCFAPLDALLGPMLCASDAVLGPMLCASDAVLVRCFAPLMLCWSGVLRASPCCVLGRRFAPLLACSGSRRFAPLLAVLVRCSLVPRLGGRGCPSWHRKQQPGSRTALPEHPAVGGCWLHRW